MDTHPPEHHFRYPLGYYNRHAHARGSQSYDTTRSFPNEHSLYHAAQRRRNEEPLIRRSSSDHSTLPWYIQPLTEKDEKETVCREQRDEWTPQFVDEPAHTKERGRKVTGDAGSDAAETNHHHHHHHDDDVIVLRPVKSHEGDNDRFPETDRDRQVLPPSRPAIGGCPSCRVVTTVQRESATAGEGLDPAGTTTTVGQIEGDRQIRTSFGQEPKLPTKHETDSCEPKPADPLFFSRVSVPSQEDEEQLLQQWKERQRQAIQQSEEVIMRPRRRKRFTLAHSPFASTADVVLVTAWEVKQHEMPVADPSRRSWMPTTSRGIVMLAPVMTLVLVIACIIAMDWIYRRNKRIQTVSANFFSAGKPPHKLVAPNAENLPLQPHENETNNDSDVSSLTTGEQTGRQSPTAELQPMLQRDTCPAGRIPFVQNRTVSRPGEWWCMWRARGIDSNWEGYLLCLDLFPGRVHFWRCVGGAAATIAMRYRPLRVLVSEPIRWLWEVKLFDTQGQMQSNMLTLTWRFFTDHVCGCAECSDGTVKDDFKWEYFGLGMWTSQLKDLLSWVQNMQCLGFCAARYFLVLVALVLAHRIVGAFHVGTSVHRVINAAAIFHELPLTMQASLCQASKKAGFHIFVSNVLLSIAGFLLLFVGRIWLGWVPKDCMSAKCVAWLLSRLEVALLSTAYLVAFMVAWNATPV